MNMPLCLFLNNPLFLAAMGLLIQSPICNTHLRLTPKPHFLAYCIVRPEYLFTPSSKLVLLVFIWEWSYRQAHRVAK